MELVQVMKALADETRLRILNLLMQKELCVCELEHLLDINQSNASRHLNKLTNARLIKYEKRSLYVYYRINVEVLLRYPFLKELLSREIKELKKVEQDLETLEQYIKSGITCEDLKQGKLCFNKK